VGEEALRLREPGPHHGLWLSTAHPRIVEAAGAALPDFVCVDSQHGTDLASLNPSIFETLDRFGVPGLVRVPGVDPSSIGRALDLGAGGVMVPMVENAAQAETAARACRSGPKGSRSFGMQTSRVDPFATDYRPICAIQIETAGALADLEAIAAVDGVDWLYIGPADLGLSVGGVPAADVVAVFDGSHPLAAQLNSAFSTLVETARAHGKLPGLHCGSGEAAARAMSHGFAVACVTSDLISVQAGMEEQLRLARAFG
jgi:4-hydroxy-2-oxoheptanedioate aldolase